MIYILFSISTCATTARRPHLIYCRSQPPYESTVAHCYCSSLITTTFTTNIHIISLPYRKLSLLFSFWDTGQTQIEPDWLADFWHVNILARQKLPIFLPALGLLPKAANILHLAYQNGGKYFRPAQFAGVDAAGARAGAGAGLAGKHPSSSSLAGRLLYLYFGQNFGILIFR